jgi:hypothetical protein
MNTRDPIQGDLFADTAMPAVPVRPAIKGRFFPRRSNSIAAIDPRPFDDPLDRI